MVALLGSRLGGSAFHGSSGVGGSAFNRSSGIGGSTFHGSGSFGGSTFNRSSSFGGHFGSGIGSFFRLGATGQSNGNGNGAQCEFDVHLEKFPGKKRVDSKNRDPYTTRASKALTISHRCLKF